MNKKSEERMFLINRCEKDPHEGKRRLGQLIKIKRRGQSLQPRSGGKKLTGVAQEEVGETKENGVQGMGEKKK